MPAASTVIDLMRHGEVAGGNCYRGWLDDPLTAAGWQQMTQRIEEPVQWQQIITSPLRRCASFAEKLSRDSDLPITYLPALREIGFGDWEGKTAQELEQHDKASFFAFYDDPVNNTPANAEPLLLFQQRVLSAWQHIVHSYQQRRVLVVAHGGTIREILAHILSTDNQSIFDIKVPLASIHRIETHHAKTRVTAVLTDD